MTLSTPLPHASRFEKHYPSVLAADAALQRSLAARQAGVSTPEVLGRHGSLRLSFARVVVASPPTLAMMVKALRELNKMPPDGLIRFDPFLRILPRLGRDSLQLRALVTALQVQDAALCWPATAVIHGDFHPGQIVRDRSGKVWLLDLDDLALAPPEADLGNLAAWIATQAEGKLDTQAWAAMSAVRALAPHSDSALTEHFLRIALVRRALKLASRGQTWALDQLTLCEMLYFSIL